MNTDVSKIVMMILGAALLLSIIGIIGLSWMSKPIADVLPAISLATVTGMLGLIGKSPGVTDVNVVNRANDPVPVDPA